MPEGNFSPEVSREENEGSTISDDEIRNGIDKQLYELYEQYRKNFHQDFTRHKIFEIGECPVIPE